MTRTGTQISNKIIGKYPINIKNQHNYSATEIRGQSHETLSFKYTNVVAHNVTLFITQFLKHSLMHSVMVDPPPPQ